MVAPIGRKSKMTSNKIEFAVQMTCDKCVNEIKSSLSNIRGVEGVEVNLAQESVIVETSLPTSEIHEALEATGRRAVLKGYGESNNQAAAVAMLGTEVGSGVGLVKGVVRFLQVDATTCIIDGTIDGLAPGLHGLHVHECGDISDGCNSVGEHFNLRNARHGSPSNDQDNRHTGDLGNIAAKTDGRATFRLTDKLLKVGDVVGRSIVVTESADDFGLGNQPQSHLNGNSGQRMACGIIARSAGLFENSKRICACDGVSLWEERDKPLAGHGRQNYKSDPSKL